MNSLLQTPLYALHLEHNGRMVPFAGYTMPLHYAPGIIAEHRHVRSHAGLFDVSHMGQIRLRARSGYVDDAARALESLVPADILSLKPWRQRYTQLTNATGGILDDLMVIRESNSLLLIVNAACKASDLAHLRTHLDTICEVQPLEDYALLALQGPKSGEVLTPLAPAVQDMIFMDVRPLTLNGVPCTVSRSGYTGEDGFEISLPAIHAESLARLLLAHPHVWPIGLGARDSLRLEGGFCLYGTDIDQTTSPIEADLEWSIQKSRRQGGVRAGGFLGAEHILAQLTQLENDSQLEITRRRVGLRPEGRAPVRHNAPLYADSTLQTSLGVITSGGFSPTLNAPIAMGYVPPSHATIGTEIFTELRGRTIACTVSALPFVPTNFRRSRSV